MHKFQLYLWVRRLATAVNSTTGLNNSYAYDVDGLRLSKTVNGVQHKYVWQGGRLDASGSMADFNPFGVTYDLINRAQYDANTGVLGSIKVFFSLSSAIISSISWNSSINADGGAIAPKGLSTANEKKKHYYNKNRIRDFASIE